MNDKVIAVVVPTMRHRCGIDDKSVPGYIIAVAPTNDFLETYLQSQKFTGHKIIRMNLDDAKLQTGYKFNGWD
jgi:hypothetical protein